eukprot:4110497-Pleurochrysis_carterae.AAC.1
MKAELFYKHVYDMRKERMAAMALHWECVGRTNGVALPVRRQVRHPLLVFAFSERYAAAPPRFVLRLLLRNVYKKTLYREM